MSEWHEWTDDADDHVAARWRIECRGTYKPHLISGATLDDLAADFPTTDPRRAAFDALIPKVHKPFLLGSVIVDRTGQVTIRPRWAETLRVDPETRKVSLQCRCRMASQTCRYEIAINLDRLIVTLTQEAYALTSPERNLIVGNRKANKYYELEFRPGLWFIENISDADLRAYNERISTLVAEYRERRQPEMVTDTKGSVIMLLP